MALIKCPECGQSISEKAQKCPKCGYLIQECAESWTGDEKENIILNKTPINEAVPPVCKEKPPKRKFRKILIAVIAVVAVVTAASIAVIFGFGIFKPNLTVTDISISKWRLTDSGASIDYYTGTVSSEQNSPFVAVIGHYENSDIAPQFVYMENGVGTLDTMEYKDDDPSLQYKAIGYLSGVVVTPSNVSVKYSDEDYTDWSFSETTNCDVDISLSLNNGKTGLLVFDIINETMNKTSSNRVATIVDGKAQYSYYAELPYKGRGIDITIVPKFFCEATIVTEENYSTEKEYTATKEESEYSTSYSGEKLLSFPGYQDGFILYTEELKEGGNTANRNVVMNQCAFLHDGKCTLSTYDYSSNDETLLMPKYELHIRGYVTWTPLEKEAI